MELLNLSRGSLKFMNTTNGIELLSIWVDLQLILQRKQHAK
jgi:hypothetical protein